MKKVLNYDNSLRSDKALSSVNASKYSISAPIGIPLAKRVTLTDNPSKILLISKLFFLLKTERA